MRLILYSVIVGTAVIALGCGSGNDIRGGSGLLEANEVIVSAEVSGQVMSLRFDEGVALKPNDTLLVIDPSRLELELASAEAGRKVAAAQLESARVQLAQAQQTEQHAQRERDRVEKLVSSGTATQKQLDQLNFELTQAGLARETAQTSIAAIKAELAKIDADLARIKRHLKDCYPLSPSGGVVTEKYVEQGELLKPGDPIAKVSQLETLWVKIYLPAGAFAGVKIGDRATVDTEAGGGQYEGQVVWTSEEAEFTPKNVQTEKSRTNLVYAVKVKIDNVDGSLKIGMPVYVTIGQ